jgi:hypothetical protein
MAADREVHMVMDKEVRNRVRTIVDFGTIGVSKMVFPLKRIEDKG